MLLAAERPDPFAVPRPDPSILVAAKPDDEQKLALCEDSNKRLESVVDEMEAQVRPLIAALALPPVASIGSKTKTSESAIWSGIRSR